MTHTVTTAAMRLVSSKRECFYCHEPVGGTHKDSCVLIQKRVKVRAIIEYEVDYPASWGKEEIEFHRNQGTWCAINGIGEISAIFEEIAEEGKCGCGQLRYEYVADTGPVHLQEN